MLNFYLKIVSDTYCYDYDNLYQKIIQKINDLPVSSVKNPVMSFKTIYYESQDKKINQPLVRLDLPYFKNFAYLEIETFETGIEISPVYHAFNWHYLTIRDSYYALACFVDFLHKAIPINEFHVCALNYKTNYPFIPVSKGKSLAIACEQFYKSKELEEDFNDLMHKKYDDNREGKDYYLFYGKLESPYEDFNDLLQIDFIYEPEWPYLKITELKKGKIIDKTFLLLMYGNYLQWYFQGNVQGFHIQKL